MNLENYEVLPVEAQDVQIVQVDAVERANVDSQVATAKRYPRDIRRSIDNSVVMATMNQETAQSCSYALPRGGKPITGPSVHLAKIIVSNWGNMRTEAKVVQITDKQVISRGTCWDLETNVASAFEVRRSIIGKNGQRFSDDMITVTGNAANSIAYRNAVFAVIPKAITDRVYYAAQKFITGDLSDSDKLLKVRTGILNNFKNNYGITEEEVVKMCGKQTVNQIGADEISMLMGTIQALKDGDTTVDELMKPIRESKEAKKDAMKKAISTSVDETTGEIFNQTEQ
ncbi:hypothetical protein F3B77_11730 [Bacteroides ovatus]|jgi:hypothetical protein|uniref:Uncharacterized protein n=1 Tax=Bacteroides ovatus TaxID=28116 RepID=A0A5M5M528_BACOV|nr:hypothetical protein [Bacteroides ovatus]KAA2651619.1 hypothetical protein F2S03_15450 [Alistipes onderdonkii]KAA4070616.1 hypothetical protein F3D37_09065 [Bacteroides ovatus]KAA4078656.1 hypothetical protein F3D38_10110 [Bacteroides ovatus]KAA4097534.1 hypothetical protein F3D40_12060 [Bacteroides ovatus]KAA4112522.1 hypothetical protein F3D35_12990 [Bacteroides ovatus]